MADHIPTKALEPTRLSSPATGDAYPEERWEPGDIVIAANKLLWTRASAEDAAKGWPWGHGGHVADYPGNGAVEEEYPVRPLTLLVRHGRPVTTIQVPGRAIEPLPPPVKRGRTLMTISFHPGGAQWDSIGYDMFRRRLADLEGIDLHRMRGFTSEDPLDWEDFPTALEPLLNSSSVRGFISGESCRKMLPRLRVILGQWAAEPELNENEAYDLQALVALKEGMEHCAQHGCALSYG